MREDLIKIISKKRDITNIVICTFNIDLIFVETVFLRALKRCGHPSLTIFADAEEVSRTFNVQGWWLSSIGRRYRVIPVSMTPGYRFHPKVVFLSSPKEAMLFVGSGNLTFGGYRQNDEIWTSFSTLDDENTGPIAAFQSMALNCLELSGTSKGATREINEAFDKTTRDWVNELEEPDTLLWRLGKDKSLLDQIIAKVEDVPIERVLICSPYYDEGGVALQKIIKEWQTANIDLLVQPGQSTLTQKALARIRPRLRLHTVYSAYPEKENAFIHAKFYALYSGHEVLLFSGSANCSKAALLTENSNGNAETLVFQRVTVKEFEENILSELEIIQDEPTIDYQHLKDQTDMLRIPIRILNASYERGSLSTSFKADENVVLDTCWADEKKYPIKSNHLQDRILTIQLPQAPRSVRLEGTKGKIRVSSLDHWVDQEFHLSASSRQRKLAISIETNVGPTSWSFKSWTEIMRLVVDHINYDPVSSQQTSTHKKNEEEETKVYSSEDFFAEDYRLPNHPKTNIFYNEEDRILGLQRLLLDYFGVETETAGLQTEHEGDDTNDTSKDDEAVDQPEIVKSTNKKSTKRKRRNLTEAEERRACKISTKLIGRLLREDFLKYRHQDLLANDLTIISVLLIAGRSEGWLPRELFLKLTYDIWTRLFFDCGLESKEAMGKGWLQIRAEMSDDPKSFFQSVGTVPLSAALAIWSFLCPKEAFEEYEKKRFKLATRMAVARAPWIWNLHRIEEVACEIDRIVNRTGWVKTSINETWSGITKNWNTILGEGRALYGLEKLLSSQSIQDWRKNIDSEALDAGTLLWQGHLGYAVTTEKISSKTTSSVNVLLLRSEHMEANISSSYVLPIKFVLPVLSSGHNLRQEDVMFLNQFIQHL